MDFIKDIKAIDFLGKRTFAYILSALLITISIGSMVTKGFNFGIDFTGGTLVEVGYADSVDVDEIRQELAGEGFEDAQVQYFGSSKDVLIRLPANQDSAAKISADVMSALRVNGETVFQGTVVDATNDQYCIVDGSEPQICAVQMRRVEFVGPQVGDELAEKGGLAMIYALIGILIYVALRFEWRFSVGSVVALVHDVILTLGFFSLFQFEFNLPVVAAVLAVIGYSLNDTIVVFDRIRENFRRMHKSEPVEIMNQSINQTLARTILTSLTTILVLASLLIFGGEVIRSFAIALFVGVFIGTYSSIFIASPTVLMLGVQRDHLLPVEKEGADQDALY